MNWQREREMAPKEYRSVIQQLGMSRAAAGRYLGVSARTSRRYAHGDAEVPPAQVLLLRALLVLASVGIKPVVPRWRPEQN